MSLIHLRSSAAQIPHLTRLSLVGPFQHLLILLIPTIHTSTDFRLSFRVRPTHRQICALFQSTHNISVLILIALVSGEFRNVVSKFVIFSISPATCKRSVSNPSSMLILPSTSAIKSRARARTTIAGFSALLR